MRSAVGWLTILFLLNWVGVSSPLVAEDDEWIVNVISKFPIEGLKWRLMKDAKAPDKRGVLLGSFKREGWGLTVRPKLTKKHFRYSEKGVFAYRFDVTDEFSQIDIIVWNRATKKGKKETIRINIPNWDKLDQPIYSGRFEGDALKDSTKASQSANTNSPWELSPSLLHFIVGGVYAGDSFGSSISGYVGWVPEFFNGFLRANIAGGLLVSQSDSKNFVVIDYGLDAIIPLSFLDSTAVRLDFELGPRGQIWTRQGSFIGLAAGVGIRTTTFGWPADLFFEKIVLRYTGLFIPDRYTQFIVVAGVLGF